MDYSSDCIRRNTLVHVCRMWIDWFASPEPATLPTVPPVTVKPAATSPVTASLKVMPIGTGDVLVCAAAGGEGALVSKRGGGEGDTVGNTVKGNTCIGK
jgi:hypothetical protein